MIPQLIGYACDLAANEDGAARGPFILQKSAYLKPFELVWQTILETKSTKRQLDAMDTIQTLCKTLALQIRDNTQAQRPFLTVGGDHSCAIGTWNGAAQGLAGPLGLIWVDAHMDAHTPKTSLSNNIHGMPLAALLGYGNEKLTHLIPEQTALSPDNLVLVGIRSFEESEANLLNRLNVRIYFMEEIKERGIEQVMQEAISHVSKNTKGFGISIDIDALDPEEAPGVSTPEKSGIHSTDFLASLSLIAQQTQFIGAEIAEFNPKNDQHHKTEKLIAQIIQRLFNGSPQKNPFT